MPGIVYTHTHTHTHTHTLSLSLHNHIEIVCQESLTQESAGHVWGPWYVTPARACSAWSVVHSGTWDTHLWWEQVVQLAWENQECHRLGRGLYFYFAPWCSWAQDAWKKVRLKQEPTATFLQPSQRWTATKAGIRAPTKQEGRWDGRQTSKKLTDLTGLEWGGGLSQEREELSWFKSGSWELAIPSSESRNPGRNVV